jgi:ribosome-associated heat shock protein Hsp15
MREDRRRLDKWLFFARFAKSRSIAAEFVARATSG